MNKTRVKYAAFVIAALLLLGGCLLPSALSAASAPDPAAPAQAVADLPKADGDAMVASKEEVVYANLTAAGAVKEGYVVNILDLQRAGGATDYGEYASVKNLTNTDPLTSVGGAVTLNAPAGKFYYQGNLSSVELPWNIAVEYTLDGSAISPDQLAGKSGRLTIEVKTSKNEKADSGFYDNYMLQIGITLDSDRSDNVESDGTQANAGKNKLITCVAMPGKDSSAKVLADVTDFEMQGISLSGVPFSMNIETPDTEDMTKDMEKLSDAIVKLNRGVGSLKSGAEALSGGLGKLSTGSGSFLTGMRALSANSAKLVSGSKQIEAALSTIVKALDSADTSSLGALGELPEGLSAIASGLTSVSGGLTQFKAGFNEAIKNLKSAVDQIPDGAISQTELGKLYASAPGSKDVIDELVLYYKGARTVKETYRAIAPALEALDGSLDTLTASVDKLGGSLSGTATQLKTSLDSNQLTKSLGELKKGLTQLSTQYGSFHKGLTEYTGGIGKLAGSYAELNSGLSALKSGAGQLASGTSELKSGTEELKDKTGDMPEDIRARVDDLMADYDKSGFVPHSFTSSQNGGVAAVQFVISTDKIAKAKAEAQVVAETAPLTVWQRFGNLFK